MKPKLKEGFVGVIDQVDFDNPSAQKLLSMGLTPNTRVYVKHVAPLGDPVIVNVRNYNLAIRKRDLAALTFKRCRSTS